MSTDVLGFMATALAFAGTLLLAVKGSRFAGWGFVAYLASNALWIVYGLSLHLDPVVFQNAGFLVTSLLGIYTWLIRPRRAASTSPNQPGEHQ